MKHSVILAGAGALTSASLEVLLPEHGWLPTAIERWGAEPMLLAAAVEGALVFLLFARWLPTEAPWRDVPPDPDPEGTHHLARRIAISVPLLAVYVGQRFFIGAERVGLVLWSSIAELAGGVVCGGPGPCETWIAATCAMAANLLFAGCVLGPLWWAEAEATASWDRHHHHHRHGGAHP